MENKVTLSPEIINGIFSKIGIRITDEMINNINFTEQEIIILTEMYSNPSDISFIRIKNILNINNIKEIIDIENSMLQKIVNYDNNKSLSYEELLEKLIFLNIKIDNISKEADEKIEFVKRQRDAEIFAVQEEINNILNKITSFSEKGNVRSRKPGEYNG